MACSRSLLDLPAEVRLDILEALLVPRSWRQASYFGVELWQDKIGRVDTERGDTTVEPNLQKIHPEILRTSRRISFEGLPILYGRNRFELQQEHYDQNDGDHTVSKENERCFDTARKFFAQIGPQNVARIRHLVLPGDSIFLEKSRVKDFASQKMTIGAQHTSLQLLLSDYPNLKNLDSIGFYWANILDDEWSQLKFVDHMELVDAEFTACIVGDLATLDAIAAKVDECIVNWAFLRVIGVVEQYLPALAHIYARVPFWTRHLLVSRKPIPELKPCEQLIYDPHIDSFHPVQADVRTGSIKRPKAEHIPSLVSKMKQIGARHSVLENH